MGTARSRAPRRNCPPGRCREQSRKSRVAGRDQTTLFMNPTISFSLKDKVTVVTGAASGIGAAIAEAFARAGALAYVCDLNEHGATKLADQLEDAGLRAHAVATNVADQASCESLIKKVL